MVNQRNTPLINPFDIHLDNEMTKSYDKLTPKLYLEKTDVYMNDK